LRVAERQRERSADAIRDCRSRRCSRGLGDEDDDVGDEGMADEDVEGGETGGDQEGSCWTPRLSEG
jgi:hypothetical protein